MRHVETIFCLLINIIAYSQKHEVINIRKYTQKDGIGSYNIRKIIQDKFGFLWVASQDGLGKYDGNNFVYYTQGAIKKHKICGPDVKDILPDTTRNLLWVLPNVIGLNAINIISGEVVKTIRIPYKNTEDWNICMIKDNDYLWIGSFAGVKIYNIKKDIFEPLPLLIGNAANGIEFEVESILKDRNGNIWVCYCGYGIVVYDGNTHKIIKHIEISLLNDHLKSHVIEFFKCIDTRNGEVLFATSQGLRKINYDAQYHIIIDNYPSKLFPQLNLEPVSDLAKDSNGEIMVSGSGKLFKFEETLNNYTQLEEPSGIGESNWMSAIQCIYFDHQNNLWLGCEEGMGFAGNKNKPFNSFNYDPSTNIKLDHVRSVLPLSNGDILAGLRNGIVHINGNSGIYSKSDIPHMYNHIFNYQNSSIIVSRSDGLFKYNIGGNLIPLAQVYPEFAPYAGLTINSHLVVNDSLVILGSESNEGIFLWNPKKKNIKQIKKGNQLNILSSNMVNNIYRDMKNNTWVLSDNLISVLSENFKENKEVLLKDKSTTIPYKLFFDMCEAKHDYYITAYGWGVLQVDSLFNVKRVINTSDGLSNDGVYQIYNLNDKSLLVTSNNGLSVIDLNTNKIKNYFASDGLHSNGFEEVCGLRYGKYIYAGGVNGFTKIDPSKFSTDTVPPVFYFTNIKTEFSGGTTDTSNLLMHSLVIASNWLQTNVSFIGINYAKPESVKYRYRIKEQDSAWRNLGTQNFISLIGLQPGLYTIEAQASNEDGYWSKPVEMELVFEPKWYQTWLFDILVFIVTASLLYTLYKYRISQLKKQQQIRRTIATDLHDDIGSLLNSAKIFNNLAKAQPDQKEYFSQTDESLTEASIGLRDMIWILDNSEDTLSELMERIKKFAIPITNACGIKLNTKISVSEKKQSITKTEKRNLFLILKESINNSIKYAGCKNVTIDFYEGKKGLVLNIVDDGKGFDMQQKTYGNGLKNISERAKQINYTCEIIASPGNGTRIIIAKN